MSDLYICHYCGEELFTDGYEWFCPQGCDKK